MTNIYRKIYEKQYGPIPKDEFGRTYDIHHIDGNRNNNDISNLKAVSIKEHYDIHYSQSNWYACFLIAKKMKKTKEELSELSRKCQLQKVKNGTHPWQDRKWHRKIELEKIKNGTHPFIGGELSRNITKKRLEDRTHNFLNNTNGKDFWKDSNTNRHAKIKNDRRNLQLKKLKDGIHPFAGSGDISRERAKRLLESGQHHSQITHICPHCSKSGKGNTMKRHHFDNCKYHK